MIIIFNGFLVREEYFHEARVRYRIQKSVAAFAVFFVHRIHLLFRCRRCPSHLRSIAFLFGFRSDRGIVSLQMRALAHAYNVNFIFMNN